MSAEVSHSTVTFILLVSHYQSAITRDKPRVTYTTSSWEQFHRRKWNWKNTRRQFTWVHQDIHWMQHKPYQVIARPIHFDTRKLQLNYINWLTLQVQPFFSVSVGGGLMFSWLLEGETLADETSSNRMKFPLCECTRSNSLSETLGSSTLRICWR